MYRWKAYVQQMAGLLVWSAVYVILESISCRCSCVSSEPKQMSSFGLAPHRIRELRKAYHVTKARSSPRVIILHLPDRSELPTLLKSEPRP